MSPEQHYAERLEQRERTLARRVAADGRMGTARLSLAAAFLGLAGCSAAGILSPLWLLIPAAAFAALVVYHQRLRALRALAERGANYYRHGLERLGGSHTAGPTGDRFADSHHPYSADLDLFGARSLFQRLCTARTPMGESTLARWLLAPADLGIIRERQECVRELRERLGLREDLQVQGETPRIELRADTLERWAEAPEDPLLKGALPAIAAILAAAALVTAVILGIWGAAFPLLAVLAVEAAVSHAWRGRVQAAVSGVEHAYEDLKLLSMLLRRIESEVFAAPPLRALQERLASGSLTASAMLSKLATLANFVEARRNPFLAPLLLPSMYAVHAAAAAERWRRRHGAAVVSWLEVLGEFEALESIAAYGFERPQDTDPQFLEGPAAFIASGLGHPLIAPQACVRNDVGISCATRVLLVSGSNMSGKSTLLRSVGLNTVLAMAGGPVCATRLELTPLKVGASIRVNDSLHEGSSRFYAEITRLRQLVEPSPLPLLFLLDELLQGTNSIDRRIGAQGVVRALLARGGIGLVSTHDLALTEGDSLPAGALENVHFQDELTDGRLTFDFKLRPGVVTRSNGIELMRAIGLDV